MTDRIAAPLTGAQQAFVQSAESLGATAPAGALRLTELPRLSARELAALVDSGLVREAADWTYYVFRARGAPLVGTVDRIADAPPSLARPSRSRIVRSVLFWIVIILIPVLFLQLNASR